MVYDCLLLHVQNTKFFKLLFPELFLIADWVSLKMEGTDVSMDVDDTFPKSTKEVATDVCNISNR